MQLDHVFYLAPDPERTLAALRSAGLVETYRRVHTGQGTANACFCFDDAFLEILWIENAREAASAAIARTRLLERSRAAVHGTCPLGIAWRLARDECAPDFVTWAFRPPYLSAGASIAVAVESDDPCGPLLFQSPGSTPPSAWPPDRRGELQRGAGLRSIARVIVRHPAGFTPGVALRTLVASTQLVLVESAGRSWGLTLRVAESGGAHRDILIA